MVVLLVSLARRAYHFQQLASSSTPFHECRTYYLKSGLPPYSPNLNPIERLWKVMNEYVRNNIYFSSKAEFTTAINEFF
ncbi:transposase, partial [Vibrio vulnificus]|uniref:transposase n=1 Tax=Vibrio vulnificus TaxID=672 RepID=UPI001F3EADE7